MKVLAWAVLALIIDRFTKYLALEYLSHEEQGIFYLFINKGIIFSIPLPEALINILLAIIIVVVTWFLVRSVKVKNQKQALALLLILFGALSNFYDRLIYGGAIDFIDLKILPIFNLADVWIVIGVIFVLIQLRVKTIKRVYWSQ